jgi:folylpolyglutamate synthase/dihydropteroate synthase
MQINNEMIDEDMFMDIYDQISQKCMDLEIPATEFEVAFLMASVFFSNEKCDAVVLEVCHLVLLNSDVTFLHPSCFC